MAKQMDPLVEMRKRYERAKEQTLESYDRALQDIKFVAVPGHQWDSKLKTRRGDRPCYEFPKLLGHTRQVINEMRQQRPQGKVRGVEESDQALAEIMQGMCRNIEDVSNADQAYDIAFEAAVQGGFGVWRVTTAYSEEGSFDQDIFITAIRNPFSVRFDPAAVKIDRRDSNFVFVEELIPESEYEAKYGKDIKDFDDDTSARDWREAGQVRIAEYWYKKPVKRRLLALSSGDQIFADELASDGVAVTDVDALLQQNGLTIVKEREVESHKVCMRMTNGAEFLTEESEFPCQHIPIVPVWGNIQNIEGVDYWQGMVRQNKDQQRLHNVHRTAMTEAVAKAPKAPYILKMKWIKGLESFWNKANAEDYPYLPVNDNAESMPERSKQAEVPAALMQLAALDNEDIKASTGIYNASLGAQSNETSGRAINARKAQGAVSTFNYIDNLNYSIRYTYEILIDMIPQVYDTPRAVRILGADGGEKWKQLYQTVQDPQTGQPVMINDISKGKYDVAVTVGPSYATQRMESVDAFTQLAGQIGPISPTVGMLLAYQVLKNLDLPGSEDVSDAFRHQLVSQGLLPPKEGEQPPQPPPPDPRIEAEVGKINAEAGRAHADAQKTQVETQLMPALTAAKVGQSQQAAASDNVQAIKQYHEMLLQGQRIDKIPDNTPSIDAANGMQMPAAGDFQQQ
jgi:hypothetical protein